MHPDMCATTEPIVDRSGIERRDREDRWATIEQEAHVELTHAQQRYDAIRQLRRLYLTSGHPPSVLEAAETVSQVCPIAPPDDDLPF
jgi:hypothetical protein